MTRVDHANGIYFRQPVDLNNEVRAGSFTGTETDQVIGPGHNFRHRTVSHSFEALTTLAGTLATLRRGEQIEEIAVGVVDLDEIGAGLDSAFDGLSPRFFP